MLIGFTTLTAFFAAYLACGAGALWLGMQGRDTGDRAVNHGNSGEQRVARTLAKAGYAVLTDLTVRQGTRSGVYHFEGERWYGNTEEGAYVCEKQADAAGDRPTENGQ